MTTHSDVSSDPADLTASQAISLIKKRKLSSRELIEASIERVEQVNPAVNALVAYNFDALRKEADAADQRQAADQDLPVLHGIPFGVKDMIDVSGLPTTFGSELFKHNIAKKDDAMVAAMRSAGAMPLGKTNNPEWSAGGNTRNRVYGVTANPYDLSRNCGGSSGGSAVALACGFSPLATGSDTGGSLRTPAAYCGVVGFRPSPGVVPGNTRAMGLLPFSTSGPMARTVEDCALMLSVLARPDQRDPYTNVMGNQTLWKPESFQSLASIKLNQSKFAITEDFNFAPVESAVRQQFRNVIAKLEPFLPTLHEATPNCDQADRIFSVLRGVLFLGMHPKFVDEQPELVGPNVTDNVKEGRSYSAEDVAQAMTAQGRYYQAWQTFFESHDYIITPSVTINSRDWHELYPTHIDGKATKNYYHWLSMAYTSTIAGHPSITIPCGRDINGLPFGIQIIGKRHDDYGVLCVAQELESIIKGISDLAPQTPNFEQLMSATPISQVKGFLDFE